MNTSGILVCVYICVCMYVCMCVCVYLLANDGDKLLVFILISGEDDPCTRGIPDLTDVCTAAPNQEAVVLLLGTYLQ